MEEEKKKELTSEDYMPKWKICRICLTSDTKLYNMKKYNIFLYYKQLTRIYEKFTEELPNYLCWDCATRMISAVHFKHQAIRGQTVLKLLSNTVLDEPELQDGIDISIAQYLI